MGARVAPEIEQAAVVPTTAMVEEPKLALGLLSRLDRLPAKRYVAPAWRIELPGITVTAEDRGCHRARSKTVANARDRPYTLLLQQDGVRHEIKIELLVRQS